MAVAAMQTLARHCVDQDTAGRMLVSQRHPPRQRLLLRRQAPLQAAKRLAICCQALLFGREPALRLQDKKDKRFSYYT
jgi:hypothetical protein